GRVNMNGAKNLVEADIVAHRQYILGDQVARVGADNGDAKNTVLAWLGKHLDESLVGAIGNGAIEVVNAETCDFVGNALLLRILFVQSDARHFRRGKGCPGNHAIIGGKFFQVAKQAVD